MKACIRGAVGVQSHQPDVRIHCRYFVALQDDRPHIQETFLLMKRPIGRTVRTDLAEREAGSDNHSANRARQQELPVRQDQNLFARGLAPPG